MARAHEILQNVVGLSLLIYSCMKDLVFSHFTTIVKLWQVEQVPMYIDIRCLRCDPLSVLFWPLFLCHLSLQAMGPAGPLHTLHSQQCENCFTGSESVVNTLRFLSFILSLTCVVHSSSISLINHFSAQTLLYEMWARKEFFICTPALASFTQACMQISHVNFANYAF